ncbi:MAG: abortive infection family protein [Caenispirillum sp.]|nr:abortive infection family protein [Caenispirillum sp.]
MGRHHVLKTLNLAPSQHTEDSLKAILGVGGGGGSHTVVQNLGALRNRLGDAHGKGRRPYRPAPRTRCACGEPCGVHGYLPRGDLAGPAGATLVIPDAAHKPPFSVRCDRWPKGVSRK